MYIPDTITEISENAFENYIGTINVQAESKPEDWDDNWNPENATVGIHLRMAFNKYSSTDLSAGIFLLRFYEQVAIKNVSRIVS